MPKDYSFGINEKAHPFVQQYGRISGYNLHFKTDADVHRALCGYYGLVSYLDDKVGQLLRALSKAGLNEDTRVLYLSDHGDNAGASGLWGKDTMYSKSVSLTLSNRGTAVDKVRVITAA